MNNKPKFTVVVTTERTWRGVPMANRLRAFLKTALRAYGIRCVSITDHRTPRHSHAGENSPSDPTIDTPKTPDAPQSRARGKSALCPVSVQTSPTHRSKP